MATSNNASNANRNGIDVMSPLSDDDGQNSVATSQASSDRVSIPAQRAASSQTNDIARVIATDQIINQHIASESDHHDLQRRRATMSAQRSNSRAVPYSRRSTAYRFPIRLGCTQPWPSEYTPDFNQGGQGAARAEPPSDEVDPLDLANEFSSTIEIYNPPPGESTGVEDTQPHDMPIPVAVNNTRHELFIDDENNRAHVNATAHNNLGANMDLTMHNESVNQAFVGENARTTAPLESSRDTDFSVAVSDPQTRSQLNVDNHLDEHHHVPNHVHTMNGNHDLIQSNQVQVLPNNINGIPTLPNQTNINLIRAVAKNTSSPHASDNERNVYTPAEGAYQSTGLFTPSSNISIPKVPSPVDSGDESGEDNTA